MTFKYIYRFILLIRDCWFNKTINSMISEPMSCIAFSEGPGYLKSIEKVVSLSRNEYVTVTVYDKLWPNVPMLNGYVMGVFPADRLPKRLPVFPYGFVANTAVHSRAGHHWCAFYRDGNRYMEFFDSYRKQPDVYTLNTGFQVTLKR